MDLLSDQNFFTSNLSSDNLFTVFSEYLLIASLFNQFASILREHIINKVVTIRSKDKPWMSNEVRRALRFKDRAFSRYKKVPTYESVIR
jgi:hypothetical protein